MRTIELLALLADQGNNTNVYLQTDGPRTVFRTFRTLTENESLQLIFEPQTGGHPLKVWELRVLINRPELRGAYLLGDSATGPHAIFGFQEQDDGLVLH
ncbi:hypothetical protein [Lacticaseibacillus mingshuiensis]|uniref:Uncharacterized protein n=1 Tax=Lacticaseibacillus mingshuiensis TaxID=2799574 RepID=A0ABW4CIS1_9LACO|nr:hypothetical protein [Lacticaseibacillus mingshuiensis]